MEGCFVPCLDGGVPGDRGDKPLGRDAIEEERGAGKHSWRLPVPVTGQAHPELSQQRGAVPGHASGGGDAQRGMRGLDHLWFRRASGKTDELPQVRRGDGLRSPVWRRWRLC